jgi:hypothetical protein
MESLSVPWAIFDGKAVEQFVRTPAWSSSIIFWFGIYREGDSISGSGVQNNRMPDEWYIAVHCYSAADQSLGAARWIISITGSA